MRRPVERVVGRYGCGQLVGVVREVTEGLVDEVEGVADAGGVEGGDPGAPGVDAFPAELGRPELEPGELRHRGRAGHVGHGVRGRHHQVGQAEEQRRS